MESNPYLPPKLTRGNQDESDVSDVALNSNQRLENLCRHTETSHPSCKWEADISAVDTYYSGLVPDVLLAVLHRSALRCRPKVLAPHLRALCTLLLPHDRAGHSCQREKRSFSCTSEWFALQSKQVNAIPCNYKLHFGLLTLLSPPHHTTQCLPHHTTTRQLEAEKPLLAESHVWDSELQPLCSQ